MGVNLTQSPKKTAVEPSQGKHFQLLAPPPEELPPAEEPPAEEPAADEDVVRDTLDVGADVDDCAEVEDGADVPAELTAAEGIASSPLCGAARSSDRGRAQAG